MKSDMIFENCIPMHCLTSYGQRGSSPSQIREDSTDSFRKIKCRSVEIKIFSKNFHFFSLSLDDLVPEFAIKTILY
jgi:hypothetical protein